MEARQRSQTPSSRPRPKKLETVKELNQGRANRQRQREQQQRRQKAGRKCPSCNEPTLEEQGGVVYCTVCYTTVEDSNIVNELTFEDGSGGPVLQGAYVGEGQTHARTMGPQYTRFGGGVESSDIALSLGRAEIRKQTSALHLPEHISETAFSLYKLASINNFVQGRRVRNVAAACIYIACRRDKKNTTLLMDLSDLIQVNVFKLGQAYRDLKKTLVIDYHVETASVPVLEVENLIERYARRLEFGTMTLKVAEDALKLVKRMKRDWMVTGRSPAGLCGACLILAARMNNFRRTVREVVYVVKAADPTISKRIEEFRRTTVSQLTVDQFRQNGLRWKDRADPPIYYYQQQKEAKRLKKLAEAREQQREDYQDQNQDLAEEVADGPIDPELVNASSVAPVAQMASSRGRPPEASSTPQPGLAIDSDGFAIPQHPSRSSNTPAQTISTSRSKDMEESLPTPITAETLDDDSAPEDDHSPRKRKRPGPPPKRTSTTATSIVITEDMLIGERELEAEMQGILDDPPSALDINDPSALATEARNRARALAEERRGSLPAPAALDEETIDEHEFSSDDEVRNCLLSEAEVRVKETIWVTHNEDWLRQQQAKDIARALRDEERAGKKPRKRRKRGRLGDGSVLEGEPVRDAADATRRMLEKRSKGFSKSIDYEKLEALYGGGGGARTSTVASSSVASSEAGSPPPRDASLAPSETDAGTVVSSAPASRIAPRKPIRQPTRGARAALPTPDPTPAEQPSTADKPTENPANNPEEADNDDEDEDEEEESDDEAGREALHTLGIDDEDDAYYSRPDGDEYDDGYDDEDIGFEGYEDE